MKRSYETPFSRQLCVWMAHANMTADDLGRLVGVTKETVYRWRAGNFPPEQDRWDAIAQALHIDRSDIAALLTGARLLPTHVQWLAEKLAALPDEDQRVVIEQFDAILSGLGANGTTQNKQKLSFSPVVAGR